MDPRTVASRFGNSHTHEQVAGRETRECLHAWRWTQSLHSPFQSTGPQEVFLVAGSLTQCSVSKGNWKHYTNYLKAKLSEPCNRGALKNTNAAFVFLDEVTGTEESQRPTSAELYQVIFRELLSLITVTTAEFQGVLTRSKTIGADKNIQSRPVVISCCCYVKGPSWLQVGWKLLSRLAAFERDFFLPSPSSNLVECLQTELRYDTGFAMMNRLLAAILQVEMSRSSQPLPTSGHPTLAEPSCPVPPLFSVSARKNGTFWADGKHKPATGTPESQC